MKEVKKKRVTKPYYILVDQCVDKKNPQVWDTRTCPICGRDFYVRKRYKRIVCSDICKEEYVRLYGDNINKRRRETCKKKYYAKSKEEIALEHQKARETCMKKYGYEKPQQTPEYRDAMSKRFKEKDWSERSRLSNEKLIPKYKLICENDDLELLEFRNRFDCTVKCKKCGNVFDVHVIGYLSEYSTNDLCRYCHPNKNSLHETKPQHIVMGYLDELGITYEKNNRSIIAPYEIDIYIPEYNIGIEINGNFWHSEIGGNKGKDYHINKTKMANNNGVKLIQVFEDEILHKSDIVKSRIKSMLHKSDYKIYARNCSISEISYNEKHNFLNENHIDGDTISTYNYGLFNSGVLVSVLTLCKRKISGRQNMEITRFANKLNTNVVGGFSKLLTHFIKTVKPNEIITYADIRWSGINQFDSVYYKCGFTFDGTTTPNYFYVERSNYLIRLNRLNFTKAKLIKRGFDKNMTESEIMLTNDYDRLWDCGSMKFHLTPQGVQFTSL